MKELLPFLENRLSPLHSPDKAFAGFSMDGPFLRWTSCGTTRTRFHKQAYSPALSGGAVPIIIPLSASCYRQVQENVSPGPPFLFEAGTQDERIRSQYERRGGCGG